MAEGTEAEVELMKLGCNPFLLPLFATSLLIISRPPLTPLTPVPNPVCEEAEVAAAPRDGEGGGVIRDVVASAMLGGAMWE